MTLNNNQQLFLVVTKLAAVILAPITSDSYSLKQVHTNLIPCSVKGRRA